MEEVDVEELIRKAFKRVVALANRTRLDRYREALRGSQNCPFRVKNKCDNPLNPSDECTEIPAECPYLFKLFHLSFPLPTFLVPVKYMLSKGLIRLYVSNMTIFVEPTDEIHSSYANRAAELIALALQVYGDEGWKVAMK